MVWHSFFLFFVFFSFTFIFSKILFYDYWWPFEYNPLPSPPSPILDDQIEYKESRYKSDDEYDDFGRLKKKKNAKDGIKSEQKKEDEEDEEDGQDDDRWNAWDDILEDKKVPSKNLNGPSKKSHNEGNVNPTNIYL